MKKRLLAAVLGLLLLVSVAGCSLVSVNEEKDMAQVVAKVGDVEITKDEYVSMFNSLLSMYQMYGFDPTASAEELQMFQDSVLESLISSVVLDHQAKLQGLDTLTEDETAEVEKAVEEEAAYVKEAVDQQLEAEISADPALDTVARSTELYKQITMTYYGEELTAEALTAWVREQYGNNLVRTKVQEAFNSTVSVSEEEIKAYFDDLLAEQTASITEDPGSYKSTQEYYERYGGEAALYAPEGYRRVKYIKFVPDAEIGAEYTDLTTELSEMELELGELTLNGETENAARIAEIKENHAAKKAEKEKLFTEHFASSKADAQAAYARLQAGEDFNAVMMEYTKDADFMGYEVFQQKGKLMSEHETSVDWSADLKTAAMALSAPGSYTAVIENDEGYHILQYVGNETAGAKAYETFKDDMQELALGEKQDKEWNATLEAWSQDTSLVTRYPDLIRDVVKAA